MEQENKKVNEFQVVWNERRFWVDVYTNNFYRLSLPDGREVRMWRDKQEGWKGFPELNLVPEIGRQIDEKESKAD